MPAEVVGGPRALLRVKRATGGDPPLPGVVENDAQRAVYFLGDLERRGGQAGDLLAVVEELEERRCDDPARGTVDDQTVCDGDHAQ